MFFFDFLYNTIRNMANDPNNERYFLPKALDSIDLPEGMSKPAELGTKLLPLYADSWAIGAIQGPAGKTIATNFANKATLAQSGTFYIPKPGNADPSLVLTQVTIKGLENIFAQPAPNTTTDKDGYHTNISLSLNQYSNFPKLELNGRYRLTQMLCEANSSNDSTCNGNGDLSIEGEGSFKVLLTDAVFRSSITITATGTDSNRKPLVIFNPGGVPNGLALQLTGVNPTSTPQIDAASMELTVDNDLSSLVKKVPADKKDQAKKTWQKIIADMAKSAITAPDGEKGLFDGMNATLNQGSNLNTIASIISSQLGVALDDMTGALPPGSLPFSNNPNVINPADAYLFDRIRAAINTPVSNWYLPKVVLGVSTPKTVEPFTLDSITPPDQNLSGRSITNIKISNLKVVGLSNLSAPPSQLTFASQDNLEATVDIGKLNPPPAISGGTIAPPPLRGTAGIALSISGNPFTGTVEVSVNKCSLSFNVTSTGSVVDEMGIKINWAKITVDLADVTVNVNVSGFVAPIAKAVGNQSQVKQAILDKINEEIANNLGLIGDEISKAARQQIVARLNG